MAQRCGQGGRRLVAGTRDRCRPDEGRSATYALPTVASMTDIETTRAGATRRAVPTGVVICAYAVPLCILPSAVWRLLDAARTLATGSNPCASGGVLEAIYVPSLSVVSMALGLLTIGLVRPWGEVFPRWLPVVGGRPVNPRVVTTVAYAGAGLLAVVIVGWLLRGGTGQEPLRPLPPGCHQPGWDILRWYLPLLLWAPLLAIVTRDYQRRNGYRQHRWANGTRGSQSSGTKPLS
jgi:hypothetical protein